MGVLGILKLERGSALVEQQAGVIVAFVEVLENAGENLRVSEEVITCQSSSRITLGTVLILVRQRHPLRRTLVELAFESSGEEGGQRQDIFMSCKDARLMTHH